MSTGARGIIGVHPLAGFDKLLHYRLPDHLRPLVRVGSLVRVPVLRRHLLAIVAAVDTPPDVPMARLKLVTQAVYPFPG